MRPEKLQGRRQVGPGCAGANEAGCLELGGQIPEFLGGVQVGIIHQDSPDLQRDSSTGPARISAAVAPIGLAEGKPESGLRDACRRSVGAGSCRNRPQES